MRTIRTNLGNNASSEYSNFPFTSMIECHGVLLGAGPTGLHKVCCGGDDNGDDIDAYLIPATSDLGIQSLKRNRFAHFEGDFADDMEISMTGDGKTTIGPYAMAPKSDEGPQMRRVKMGRGLKFKYGKYKIANVDGGQFSIDKITLTIADERIGGI